jgi:hypothetical protein
LEILVGNLVCKGRIMKLRPHRRTVTWELKAPLEKEKRRRMHAKAAKICNSGRVLVKGVFALDIVPQIEG